MPELHKLSPSEVDLNLELFRVPTKSGSQCPTTPKQVLAMPTQAHTSSIGPQAAIVDRWKHTQKSTRSSYATWHAALPTRLDKPFGPCFVPTSPFRSGDLVKIKSS